MQDLKIYILIEDKEKESEVRIDGNFETLRELLYAIWAEYTAPASITALPAGDLKQEQRGSNATA